MPPKATRRKFVQTSLAVAATSICDTKASAQQQDRLPSTSKAEPPSATTRPPGQLKIKPRYHRWHVDPGVEWIETNTGYATLDWTIPRSQLGVVLVDAWDHHYLIDTERRSEEVIEQSLVPFLAACRSAKVAIIHAPSLPIARQHPNWVRLDVDGQANHDRSWPPADFRSKRGEFRGFRRPDEAREPELIRLRAERRLHPKVLPLDGEPVVGTGEELHRYCKQHGILFLLFTGFNTNACVLVNDYGTLAMFQRGYEVILVRDCTTGMETRESQPTLAQTNGAILFLEMFGKYSISSREVIDGLKS